MGVKLGYGLPGKSRGALRREAAAAFGVFVVLLNILAGSLSILQFGIARGRALSQDGAIMLCTGGEMVFLGGDGTIVPGEPGKPQHEQHECPCCVLMHASAVLPPPPSAPAPADLAAIQIMRPGTAQHLDAAAVPTRRNRGPPAQA